jgi:hypothetical protein
MTAKVIQLRQHGPVQIAVRRDEWDEARVELAVSLDERIAHTADVRRHLRVAMRALADGRFAFAGTFLVELERLNEREANRARAAAAEHEARQRRCPDGIEQIGHGRAA